ncbi:MAG: SpoIID/LytB domain-containing protein [Firmicutes bacterium]|nr:SpoIID/LytB domain-containing protein [Bacillota bacterium]
MERKRNFFSQSLSVTLKGFLVMLLIIASVISASGCSRADEYNPFDNNNNVDEHRVQIRRGDMGDAGNSASHGANHTNHSANHTNQKRKHSRQIGYIGNVEGRMPGVRIGTDRMQAHYNRGYAPHYYGRDYYHNYHMGNYHMYNNMGSKAGYRLDSGQMLDSNVSAQGAYKGAYRGAYKGAEHKNQDGRKKELEFLPIGKIKHMLPAKFEMQAHPYVISVYNFKTDRTYNVKLERFVANVVAGNYPNEAHNEYLKAKAVIIRTRVKDFIANDKADKAGADIHTNSLGGYEPRLANDKILSAADATRDIVIVKRKDMGADAKTKFYGDIDISVAPTRDDKGFVEGMKGVFNRGLEFAERTLPYATLKHRGNTWRAQVPKRVVLAELSDVQINKRLLGNTRIHRRNMNGVTESIKLGNRVIGAEHLVMLLNEHIPAGEITKAYAKGGRNGYIVLEGRHCKALQRKITDANSDNQSLSNQNSATNQSQNKGLINQSTNSNLGSKSNANSGADQRSTCHSDCCDTTPHNYKCGMDMAQRGLTWQEIIRQYA